MTVTHFDESLVQLSCTRWNEDRSASELMRVAQQTYKTLINSHRNFEHVQSWSERSRADECSWQLTRVAQQTCETLMNQLSLTFGACSEPWWERSRVDGNAWEWRKREWELELHKPSSTLCSFDPGVQLRLNFAVKKFSFKTIKIYRGVTYNNWVRVDFVQNVKSLWTN